MPRAGRCLHGRVDPQIRRRDQPTVGEDQRDSRPLRERHASLLQQALECSPRTAAAHAQPLTAAPPPHRKSFRQHIEIDGSPAAGHELESTASGERAPA